MRCSSRDVRTFLAALLVGMSLLGMSAPRADAGFLEDLLGIKPPPPAAAPGPPPLAAPLAADPPSGPAAGTMVMVFGSGWAGHYAQRQEQLMTRPGELLRQRGWRVVSIDYEEGAGGLQNILDTVGAELARKTSAGPLCVYGESSGAQLALVAAARLRSIDCVIGVATPTDLANYETEGDAAADSKVHALAERIKGFFGTTAEQLAPWNPVGLAPTIEADVMLVHELDDPLIAPSYATRFQAVHPTTKVVGLEAGDPSDFSSRFAHGTASQAGRARYDSAIGSFADRALAAAAAQRNAARTGCKQVGELATKIGARELLNVLRCLARKTRSLPASSGSWQRSTVSMSGEVTAARLWAALQQTRSGRSALAASEARRAKIAVRIGDPSRVTLRVRR